MKIKILLFALLTSLFLINCSSSVPTFAVQNNSSQVIDLTLISQSGATLNVNAVAIGATSNPIDLNVGDTYTVSVSKINCNKCTSVTSDNGKIYTGVVTDAGVVVTSK